MDKFEVLFLTEAREFLLGIDQRSRVKIIFNIDKAKTRNDSELFKKIERRNRGIQDIIQQNLFQDFCFLGQNRKNRNIGCSYAWIDKENRKNP